jgi:uncharacterized protein (UPF0147 family)
VQVIEVPDADASGIESGRLVYTSPELRPRFVDSQGRDSGPVIAHVALTRRPRNRNQAPLARVEANDVAVPRHSISKTQPLPESPIQGVLHMSQAVTLGEVGRETASDVASELENDTASERAVETASGVVTEAQGESASAAVNDAENETASETASEVASDDSVAPYVPAAEASLDGDAERDEPGNESSEGAGETASGAQDDEAPQRELHRAEYRQQLTRRILTSQKLPRGLRERLVSAVEAVQLSDDGSEEPTLRVSDAVAMIEESLPPQLALAADELQRPGHPHGEAFFTGDALNLSDEEAARIARDQLTSVGLLPRRGRAVD